VAGLVCSRTQGSIDDKLSKPDEGPGGSVCQCDTPASEEIQTSHRFLRLRHPRHTCLRIETGVAVDAVAGIELVCWVAPIELMQDGISRFDGADLWFS
jgi:hypothetical protein